MASRNETIRIDVEAHIADIDKEVKSYEKKLKSLQKQAQDMGFGDNVVDDIQRCINKLNELKSEYSSDLKKLANQKIDTDSFDKFAKEVDSKLQEVTGDMTNLEEKISQLSQTMEGLNGEKMTQQLGKIKRTFQEFRHDTKEAVEVLKEFQELVNVKGNQKELQDLSKTISKLSDIDLLNLKGVKATKGQLTSLQEELGDAYQTYKELQDILNDSTTSPTMLKNTEKKVADLIPQITELIKKVAQINKFDQIDLEQFATGYTFDTKMFGQFDFDEILNEIDEGTENIRERLNDRASKLQSEMKTLSSSVTTATTFQFEDGGVQIPVVLNKEAMQNCKAELETLISNLTKVSKDNPVDVTLRLFPLKSDQSEAKEVTDYIKNIRAQIPELPEGELKESVSNFMNQFEKEYQKALILKIKVALSDDVESVTKKINEIKQVAKKSKIEINPSFRITEKEETKLKNKINKVKKDFSFDVAGELTKMSDSLTNLLSSTNPSAWTTAFAEGLGEVRGKLLAMQELINPLYKLMNEKSGTGQPGRPSTETVANRSYVEKFTIAVDSLNNALKAYNKTKSATKADDFVTDVQKQVDESGRVVEIPVSPVVKGFVEKVQDAIGDVPLNITVGGVTASNEGTTTVVTQSKTKQTTGSQTSSQKVAEEKKEEVAARQQNINVTKREIDQINTFNHALDQYIETIRKMKSTNSLKGTDTAENTLGIWSNAYPELREINDYPSALQREELTTKYLNRLGIDRQSHYSPEAQWEQLSYLANKKGKKDYKDIIDKFVQYEEDGGTKAITELTKNKNTQNSLEANYKKFAENIRKKKQEIAEEILNEEDYGDLGNNKPDPKALAEYEKLNAAVEENTEKTKENQQVKTQANYEAEIQALAEANQKLVENTEVQEENKNTKTQADYEAEILALAKQNQAIEENTQKVEKNTQAKKENAKSTEDYINDIYNYAQANSNDNLTDEQLAELYGLSTNNKQTSEKKTTTKKQGLTLTDKLKSKIAGQQAKGLIDLEGISDREFNLVIDDIVDGINRKVIDLNEGVEHFKLIINNLKNAKNTMESSFLQTDIVDEENIKQQAKQQGEEAGKAAVEGAKEGTQEAQDSNSPSKVAEALGDDWGTGYANGILKSEDEVKAAVRQLVSSGTMTAQEIINDIPNITADSKYKDLVTPTAEYKADYKKAITQVKGKITELENAEDLSPEQLDKYDANFNTWINKLKELGVDVTQFQNEYNAVRSKFGASLKESLQEVENQLKKEAEEAEEARKKIWDSFFAEGEKYDQTEETIKTQKTYTELKAAVDEYVKARKRIAQGNPFEHDVENVEKLNDRIIELSEKLNNGKLVDKATSGLTGLEDKIAEIEQKVAQKTQQKITNTFSKLKGKIDSSIYDVGFEIDKGKNTQEFEQRLINIKTQLEAINAKPIDVITQNDIDQANSLLAQVREIRKEGKLTENITANKNSIQKNLAQVNSILSSNTKFAFKNTNVYKDLVSLQTAFKNFDTSKPQSELAELTTKLLATKAKFEELDNTIKGKNLFQTFIERLHGTTAQLFAMYLSWMDIIRYTRTMINTIKDLDTQLVDLRKTTTMTASELNEFYYASSDVAKQLGVTTSEIISQAAAWSRFNKIDPLYGNI